MWNIPEIVFSVNTAKAALLSSLTVHSSMTSKLLQKQWWKSLLTKSVPKHSLVLPTTTIVVVVPGSQYQTMALLGGETVPWVQIGLNRTLECLSIWNLGEGGYSVLKVNSKWFSIIFFYKWGRLIILWCSRHLECSSLSAENTMFKI